MGFLSSLAEMNTCQTYAYFQGITFVNIVINITLQDRPYTSLCEYGFTGIHKNK